MTTRTDDKIERLQAKADQAARFRVASPANPRRNARHFIEHEHAHPERELGTLIYWRGDWYSWRGQCWEQVAEEKIKRALYFFFERGWHPDRNGELVPFRPNQRNVGDILDALRSYVLLSPSFEAPGWLNVEGTHPARELVPLANGLLHVPTRELLPHTPALLLQHVLPFAFDPDATAPGWLHFLDEVFPNDLESIECLQQILGYMLTADTSQQKIFLFVGARRSGKGTCARIITSLLGRSNVAHPTLEKLSKQFGLESLIGKPLAIVPDARTAREMTTVVERLLSISGEDALDVERKYRAAYSGQLPCRVLILSNEIPRWTDASGALASRFIVIRMRESFLGREDLQLTHKLTAELPGIMNWALQGLERLQAAGHFKQPASAEQDIGDMLAISSPVSAFLDERCEIAPGAYVECNVLYHYWVEWCETQGQGNYAGGAAEFGRKLRAVLPKLERKRSSKPGRAWYYVGLGLRDPDEK